MSKLKIDQSRRFFFLRSAGMAATAAAAGTVARTPAFAATPGEAASRTVSPHGNTYVFFNPEEATFIEAVVARLIPPDETGPGAVEAGVPFFIDRQLAGAWGAGERLHRSGPWHTGTPQQGYQLPYHTPAELFRTALAALREKAAQAAGGRPFACQSPAAQDEFLHHLQTGTDDLGGVPANVFFESLWGLTIEGYFSDPVYGSNRGMLGWKTIGFPGAYADYHHLIDRQNTPFEGPPVSLADNGRGVIPSSRGAAVPPPGHAGEHRQG